MTHEAGNDVTADAFFQEGLRIVEEERLSREAQADEAEEEHRQEARREITLLQGKAKRNELKRGLLARLQAQL